MQERIKEALARIEDLSKTKPIRIISHYDADGITSAAVFSRAMQRWGKRFTLQIVKSLDEKFIESLPNEILIFLDLASGSLDYLSKKNTEVFIFDHHEIEQSIPNNVTMINPLLFNEENCSGAAICYLVARELSKENKDLANLAVIGMTGDQFIDSVSKTYDGILKDAEINVRKGLLLYPATRPLDRALEYSSSLYIPGVTGSFKGVSELLREANIERTQKGHKSLVELTNDEMSRLITAIMLRRIGNSDSKEIVGNIYLTKWFNQLEDVRELAAMINSCSRMGFSDTALALCLGNKNAKKEAEKIYVTYRQSIAAALKYITETEKITGKNYTIINARDQIKDTIIGTAASIMAFSPLYEEGTIIIAMAYDKDKIKISARVAGRKGRNVREILSKALGPLEGEVGGHPNAAGGLISKDKESQFITELQNLLDIEVVKV